MSDFENDPATMTPEQRFQEVAAILAHGVLRLRAASLFRTASASERPYSLISGRAGRLRSRF